MDLARLFEQLRPPERAMMWLAYVEGADHDEIARALGIRPRSVRVILYRTRRKLARLLDGTGHERGMR
jgi:RNA polymerase sigma-70 factor (ECF subfamily)